MNASGHKSIFFKESESKDQLQNTPVQAHYIPSLPNTHIPSAKTLLFKPDKENLERNKSSLDYKPVNYSQSQEEEICCKPSKSTSQQQHSLFVDCSEHSQTDLDQNRSFLPSTKLLKPGNNLSPLANRITRIRRSLLRKREVPKAAEVENSLSFEFSASDSYSDLSSLASNDLLHSDLSRSTIGKETMPSSSNVAALMDRFRNGKPRPPISRKGNYEQKHTTSTESRSFRSCKNSSVNNNSSPNGASADLRNGKNLINEQASKPLEERDLNQKMHDVEIDRLLKQSAVLTCGETEKKVATRVPPASPTFFPHQGEGAPLQAEAAPFKSHVTTNDDILYQWRLKRKMERARHVVADHRNNAAAPPPHNTDPQQERQLVRIDSCCARITEKASCEGGYHDRYRQASVPDNHQQERGRIEQKCCQCRHKVWIDEGDISKQLASSHTQTGASLLMLNDEGDHLNASPLPAPLKADFVDDADRELSVSSLDHHVKESPESERKAENTMNESVATPNVTLTGKIVKKVIGNRLFEDSLETTNNESRQIHSSDELDNGASTVKGSSSGTWESSGGEPLTLDNMLKRVEEDDGEFDDDEVMATLRAKRDDLLLRLRYVEKQLHRHCL